MLTDDFEYQISNSSDSSLISASLIKLYVAGAVYENFEAVGVQESYGGETDLMISQSDNEACNTLTERLGGGDSAAGMKAVNDFCTEHGFDDAQMNRLMLDFNGLENYTSASDCAQISRYVYSVLS